MTRRGVAVVLLLALAAATFLFAITRGGGDPEQLDAAALQRADRRVAALFVPCVRSDFYDRNTADMVPILIGKLEVAQRDPFQRAKEELAALGEAAIPELRRFIDRHYADPRGFAYLQNALDALTPSRAAGVRPILLRCLAHPSDAVRIRALRGLAAGHAEPEDFDRLRENLAIEAPEHRHEVAFALHAADPVRAAALYLGWVRDELEAGLLPQVVPLVATATAAETVAECRQLWRDARADLRPFLAAAPAAAGDADALRWFAHELEEGGSVPRRNAVNALRGARLAAPLRRVLESDPAPDLRVLAADGLAGSEDPADREVLRAGLDDRSVQVRGACLSVLVAMDDPMAKDRALAEITEALPLLQNAMLALRTRVGADPELARRALERLLERNALEELLPLRNRLATLKAIGQLPLTEAARLLRELGLRYADETLEGLRAHEWLMIQAANTGDEGRAFLLGELAQEADPLRRLDLLWAASANRSDATRERLLSLADSGALSKYELLFVCDVLTRLGPSHVVAPRLKRITNGVEDPELRTALQCLLWTWY
ncbi:MAG: hypothetical protein O7B99_09720 [Planctomycetota bacterium]|nr:hypothetical protein [Planctomycetota bacterium]